MPKFSHIESDFLATCNVVFIASVTLLIESAFVVAKLIKFLLSVSNFLINFSESLSLFIFCVPLHDFFYVCIGLTSR